MHLVRQLPDNPLDIVGDIHGELTALQALLLQLGYDKYGKHPEHRKLVFIGDLIDRGPDSKGVIALVRRLIDEGNAYAILGNHEINLLTNDIKDGSGWFFDERYEADLKNYAPFQRTQPEERPAIREFLNSLPIVLKRDDIRIVHAAWTKPAVAAISVPSVKSATEQFKLWDHEAQTTAQNSGLLDRYKAEKARWAAQLEDEKNPPPFLFAIAEYEATQQMVNPLKVLTSGVEQLATTPFFAGNRWRFSDRVSWWDDYAEDTPVVIGHYWRLLILRDPSRAPRYSQLFRNIPATAWHGKRHNVFCIDYSVGARWRDRTKHDAAPSSFKLAALQWPENRLVFDSGETMTTQPH